jgi:hypothetical protein
VEASRIGPLSGLVTKNAPVFSYNAFIACILFQCKQEIDIAASIHDGGMPRREVAESVAAANYLDHVVGIYEGTRECPLP